MTKIEVIDRIKELRFNANLSARELSLRVEKNEAYVNRLESKKSFEPSVSALLEMIAACGSTPAEFFYHNMSQYKIDQEIINKLNQLSIEKKSAVIAMINQLL